MMNHEDDAQRILRHYFRLAASGGWKWDSDNAAEVNGIVTDILAAVDAALQPAPAVVAAVPTFANPARDDLLAAVASYQQEGKRLAARMAALAARAQRAELQLADAQQANAMLTARLATYADDVVPTLQRQFDEAIARRDRYRIELEDANATAGQLAYTIADMEQAEAKLRQERDAYRAQADAARQAATEAAQRAEQTEAKWKAIPWRALMSMRFGVASNGELMAFRSWYDTNRPTAQAQD